MKKAIVAMVWLSMVAVTALAEPPKAEVPKAELPKQETDIAVTAIYYKPGQDDNYDNGFGAEAQARFWFNQNIGLALSLGAGAFQVKDQEITESTGSIAAGLSLNGDISLVPIGGSLLFKPVNNARIQLTLEAGIRYVLVNSQAEVEFATANASGDFVYVKDTIDMENGVVGVIGANIEGKVGKQVSLLAGIGYQLDLVKGESKWRNVELDNNELKALLVKIGIVINL